MEISHIHEKFAHIRDMVLTLPHCTTCDITVIQDIRNVVTRMEVAEGAFVLKDFRGMYFFNRLAYSFFRKSKAIRSYENSMRLNALGIRTPEPAAWIDQYSAGLLSRSVFISKYFPYKTLQQYMQGIEDSETKNTLLNELARFALKLHRRGVLHNDFSVGNIFVIPKRDGYDFALTDVNRMRFQKSVSYNEAMSNFRKIQLSGEDLHYLVTCYARLSSKSPAESLAVFNRLRDRASQLRRTRKKLRRYTLELFQGFRRTGKDKEDSTVLSRDKSSNSLIRKT